MTQAGKAKHQDDEMRKANRKVGENWGNVKLGENWENVNQEMCWSLPLDCMISSVLAEAIIGLNVSV